jgi:hypothetical protein
MNDNRKWARESRYARGRVLRDQLQLSATLYAYMQVMNTQPGSSDAKLCVSGVNDFFLRDLLARIRGCFGR